MKHIALLAVLFFSVSTIAAVADEAAPTLSARQALDAAEKSLSDRGLGKQVYIESVTLFHAAAFGGETFWVVKWSQALQDNESRKREVGVKVRMDGSVVRLSKSLGREVQGQGLQALPTLPMH